MHVFASFGYGGVPIRICDVANGLPDGFHHTVVALDGCFDARRRLRAEVSAEFRGLRLPRYNLLRSMKQVGELIREVRPDLLLTYNWGAIEPALANRFLGASAHIHFESGFGAEEGDGQLWRRNLFRRVALARVRKVVVPSSTLMRIAAEAWHVPAERLLQIPNGVDLQRYGGEAGRRIGAEALGAPETATVIGTVAPLRPEKNVGRLLRAFAALPGQQDLFLVIAGDGVQRAALQALAGELGIAERTRFLGHVEDVPAVLRGIDVFALSSDTEQMPNSLLQAMAAGRPVAAVDVGDVARIVAAENRPLVVPRDEAGALTEALAALVADPARRANLGEANQARVRAHYSLEGMIAAYSALFGAA
ncbi:MAG: glycosyltransferase family 4 protein [Kiloniellaceae bacterium]